MPNPSDENPLPTADDPEFCDWCGAEIYRNRCACDVDEDFKADLKSYRDE